jgi:GTP-binding protein HflX
MTGAEVMAENLLFATLDPTMRRSACPGVDKAILSDTVGFVSDLPTQLVAAFRATLEEVTAADLILHVRDISHPDTDAQAADVLEVLSEIGVTGRRGRRSSRSGTSSDLLPPEQLEHVENEASKRDDVALVSASIGRGLPTLRGRVAERLTQGARLRHVDLGAGDGAGLAWLHAHGDVIATTTDEDRVTIDVRLSEKDWSRFNARDGAH